MPPGDELELDELLRKGYLPEVLPPVFTTKSFADFALTHVTHEPVGQSGRAVGLKAVEYSATKRANQRRTFAFPHPESFYDIALFLVQHWQELEEHFDLSTYSRSRPNPVPREERAISITSHRDLAVILYKEMSPYRYIVKSDISRFYPTVYTHSIPWSIHGKVASKQDTNPELYNDCSIQPFRRIAPSVSRWPIRRTTNRAGHLANNCRNGRSSRG